MAIKSLVLQVALVFGMWFQWKCRWSSQRSWIGRTFGLYDLWRVYCCASFFFFKSRVPSGHAVLTQQRQQQHRGDQPLCMSLQSLTKFLPNSTVLCQTLALSVDSAPLQLVWKKEQIAKEVKLSLKSQRTGRILRFMYLDRWKVVA